MLFRTDPLTCSFLKGELEFAGVTHVAFVASLKEPCMFTFLDFDFSVTFEDGPRGFLITVSGGEGCGAYIERRSMISLQ